MRNSSYALRDKAGLGPACASPRRLRLNSNAAPTCPRRTKPPATRKDQKKDAISPIPPPQKRFLIQKRRDGGLARARAAQIVSMSPMRDAQHTFDSNVQQLLSCCATLQ